jgi:alanyl aminopeptidase
MLRVFQCVGWLLTVLIAPSAFAADSLPCPAGDGRAGTAGIEIAQDLQAPRGRLPEGVRPTAYRLSLDLDPRRERFTGQVEIDIALAEAVNGLWLHGKDIDVGCAVLRTHDGDLLPARYEQVLESGVARVQFAGTVAAGTVTLALNYSAAFDDNLSGLFRIEAQGESYALAKSESIQARKFLPGFDEPGMKATFAITMTIPQAFEAVSNGAAVSREMLDDGRQRIRFAQTRPLSTYLLSIAVGPFDVIEAADIPANDLRDRPIPLRGIARRGKADTLRYVLSVTPRMVEIFERELQQPYPYDKLDIVAAPQWPSGATELAAAITYREPLISIAGDTPAPGARLALLSVHAHELAHMWFGNLVTPPWWDDLWLKEGFATWGTPLALARLEPEGGHELNAARRAISAMRLDSLASTRSIREPIDDNANVRNAYDAITYSKSLGVIHMVDSYFGADRFRPALGAYIASFADGAADSAAFYRSIARQTGTPELLDSFRSFVEQPGVPELSVALDCSGGTPRALLSQQRYRPLGSSIAGDQRWTVPVCLRTDDGERQCTLLAAPQATLPLGAQCPDWVLPNAGGDGYYRWRIGREQWQALLRDFATLTAIEALSAVDSAFAAFEAGTLEPDILIAVVEAAAATPWRQVVTAPLPKLSRYRSDYREVAAGPAFDDFLRRIYGKRLITAAGDEPQDAESRLLQSQLTAFLATTARSQDIRQALLERARRFTGFPGDPDPDALEEDLFEAALRVAVEELGAGFVGHLLEFREALDDPQFDSASADAMGASPDALQVQQLLMGDRLDSRERFQLFERALRSEATGEAHWTWFTDNFAAVLERLPAQWRRRTPGFADAFCSDEKRESVSALFARFGSDVPGHERALAQTRERLQLCSALRQQVTTLVAVVASQPDGA